MVSRKLMSFILKQLQYVIRYCDIYLGAYLIMCTFVSSFSEYMYTHRNTVLHLEDISHYTPSNPTFKAVIFLTKVISYYIPF